MFGGQTKASVIGRTSVSNSLGSLATLGQIARAWLAVLCAKGTALKKQDGGHGLCPTVGRISTLPLKGVQWLSSFALYTVQVSW